MRHKCENFDFHYVLFADIRHHVVLQSIPDNSDHTIPAGNRVISRNVGVYQASSGIWENISRNNLRGRDGELFCTL